jgi:predicted kinase
MIPFHKGVIILTGNIGTGKSTFSNTYKSKYWQYRVYVLEMDRYVPKIQNYSFEQQKEVLSSDLKPRIELYECVVIDGANLSKKGRQLLFECFIGFNVSIISVDFGLGNDDSLERRKLENRGVSSEDWEKEHMDKQVEYEKPSREEGFLKLYIKVGVNEYTEIES